MKLLFIFIIICLISTGSAIELSISGSSIGNGSHNLSYSSNNTVINNKLNATDEWNIILNNDTDIFS
jgi:hypothetical protein